MNNKLNYCPACGGDTLSWDLEKKWSCHCGFVLFNNVAAAVAVIIRHGDEIFLTRRNQNPQKGKLDLAGGFTDPGETGEETCRRELYEELKLEVDLSRLKYMGSLPNIYHYKGIDYQTLDLFYEYTVDARFEPDPEISEISETVWIPKSRIQTDDLAFDSQKKFLKEYCS